MGIAMKKVHMMHNHQYQQGAVLVVGLIMVLLMSIIAMASIRGSGLQEAMAGNMRQRMNAFEAADSAMSNAEFVVRQTTFICDSSTKCLRDPLAPSASPFYNDYAATLLIGQLTNLGLGNIVAQPVYVIERLSPYQTKDGGALDDSTAGYLSKRLPYRITATGEGGTIEAQALVQSSYHMIPNE